MFLQLNTPGLHRSGLDACQQSSLRLWSPTIPAWSGQSSSRVGGLVIAGWGDRRSIRPCQPAPRRAEPAADGQGVIVTVPDASLFAPES